MWESPEMLAKHDMVTFSSVGLIWQLCNLCRYKLQHTLHAFCINIIEYYLTITPTVQS